MAKICPITDEPVLYLDCQDCDDKRLCRQKMGEAAMQSEAAIQNCNPHATGNKVDEKEKRNNG